MTSASLPAYLINLDRSPTRLASASAQLAGASIAFERIAAVDGRAPGALDYSGYDAARSRRRFGTGLLPGEIGCYQSHLTTLARLVADGHPEAMIFEDDLILAPDTMAAASDAVAWLRRHRIAWDVIHLACPRPSIHTRLAPVGTGRTLIAKHNFATLTVGLIWSREGAQRFLARHARFHISVDVVIADAMTRSGRGFAIHPPPVTLADVTSDIRAGTPETPLTPRQKARQARPGMGPTAERLFAHFHRLTHRYPAEPDA